ncbi:MAG: hypothetical protein ACI4DY_14455 [Monoglobaceae bacterium]
MNNKMDVRINLNEVTIDTMHSSIKKSIILICTVYLAAAMIIYPHGSIEAARTALSLCANVAVPSLFPFMFCANMFIALGAAGYARRYLSRIMQPLFGVTGAGAAALVCGVVSGYPVGAVCAAELYRTGECSKIEAERLLAFCNNSGPMFVIGAVGAGMFKSREIGAFLYIIHVFSALITGMIFKHVGGREGGHALPPSATSDIKNTAADIGAAVTGAVRSMLTVCGFVVIFSVLVSAIPNMPLKPYIHSVLEITGGLAELTRVCRGDYGLTAASALIAFSGVSVMAQVASVAEGAGLSVMPYFKGKCCQAAVAAVLTLVALRITPMSVDVFGGEVMAAVPIPQPEELFYASVKLIALCAAAFAAVFAVAEIAERIDRRWHGNTI